MKIHTPILVVISLLLVSTSVSAISSNQIRIDSERIKQTVKTSQSDEVIAKLNSIYNIKIDMPDKKTIHNEEIEELSKKLTYLFLGTPDKKTSSLDNYISRQKELLAKYTKNKSDRPVGFSELSVNFDMEDIVNENIRYDNYGIVNITYLNDKYESASSEVVIDGVLRDKSNEKDPLQIDTIESKMIISISFKKHNNRWTPDYFSYRFDEDSDNLFKELEIYEQAGLSKSLKFDYTETTNYDFSKLKQVSDEQINSLAKKYENTVVNLNSFKDKTVNDSAVGFAITNNFVVTSWKFINNALSKSEFLTVSDSQNNLIKLDGIVVIEPKLDLVVLKVSGSKLTPATIAKSTYNKQGDPVIVIGSKSGFGISGSAGIVTDDDLNEITSLIPTSPTDAGGPLVNLAGEVIGLNDTRRGATTTTTSINIRHLIDYIDELNKLKIDNSKLVSFETLKKNYYFSVSTEEKVLKNIPTGIWNQYKKVGDIETTIKLDLIKSSFYSNSVSLRYKNNLAIVKDSNLIAGFTNKLSKTGYKKVFDSTNKTVYIGSDYSVIINKDFNLLTVLITKK